MHEIGMMYQLAKLAVNCAKENHVKEIRSVSIEIGELSGALPQVFEEYFPYIAEQYSELKHSELIIHKIPGEALCKKCGSLYNLMRQKGICPKCQSKDKKILGGRDIRLINISYLQDLPPDN